MEASRAGRSLLLVTVLGGLAACSTVYYRTLDALGVEKRTVLVDRVEDARDRQNEAKEQFASALEAFRAVVAFEGGDLESLYDRLNGNYERSERRAAAVRDRIDGVEDVAGRLFEEWEDELEEYSDPSLRRQSETLLGNTRERYADVLRAMRRAEATMQPVLETLQDQVLFLRHNLNARAVGALDAELDSIERDTTALIAEMERAIAEADAFIREMTA